MRLVQTFTNMRYISIEEYQDQDSVAVTVFAESIAVHSERSWRCSGAARPPHVKVLAQHCMQTYSKDSALSLAASS